MSHHDEQIVCPNCGFHASENYCARCGQETHLHNDTFLGLIVHFLGHYFHYDSKFWQTLAALWTKPGKLTIAYWNKQRMRYIPPVSLYIFLSFVFFFTFSMISGHKEKLHPVNTKKVNSVLARAEVAQISKEEKESVHSIRQYVDKHDDVDTAGQAKASVLINNMELNKSEIKEQVFHMAPKIFFFLIPLMGFVLFLLFIKRAGLSYVSHIIFAVHYHSFWFSIMFVEILYQFKEGKGWARFAAFVISVVYFVVMLKKVYGISWLRSVMYSLLVAFTYLIFTIACFGVIVWIIYSRYAR